MRIWGLINLMRDPSNDVPPSIFDLPEWDDYREIFHNFDKLCNEGRYDVLRIVLPDKLTRQLLLHMKTKFYAGFFEGKHRLYSYKKHDLQLEELSVLEAFDRYGERIKEALEYGSCATDSDIDRAW